MSEKSCLYSLNKVGNCWNRGIKYKLSALLYISYLAEIKDYESQKDGGHFSFLSFSIYYMVFIKYSSMSIISMQSQVKKINCYRKNAQNY